MNQYSFRHLWNERRLLFFAGEEPTEQRKSEQPESAPESEAGVQKRANERVKKANDAANVARDPRVRGMPAIPRLSRRPTIIRQPRRPLSSRRMMGWLGPNNPNLARPAGLQQPRYGIRPRPSTGPRTNPRQVPRVQPQRPLPSRPASGPKTQPSQIPQAPRGPQEPTAAAKLPINRPQRELPPTPVPSDRETLDTPNTPEQEFAQSARDFVNESAKEQGTLTLEQVRKYFGDFNTGKSILKQNTGNCYAIAGYEAIRGSKVGALLLASSCRLAPNDKAPNGMSVRLPLGDPSGEWVTVSFADATLPTVEPRQPREYTVSRLEARITNIKSYHESSATTPPIGGAQGVPAEALRGWQCLEKAVVQKYYLGHASLRGEGGSAGNSLRALVYGLTNQEFIGSRPEAPLKSPSLQDRALKYLGGFRNGHSMASCATVDGPSDKDTFTVGSHTLYFSHAYTIMGVTRSGSDVQRVRVSESNNPGKTLDMSLEEFLEAFVSISALDPDVRTMFSRKTK